MFNCKPSTLNEDMTKLIAAQGQLLQAYRESDQESKELLANYRKLVDLQELQISDLKLKLRELREKQ
jgi:hypothetical protein